MDTLNGFFFALLTNHLLQGCALVLILGLLLRHAPCNAASRHLAWFIVLLAILLMPLMPWLPGMDLSARQSSSELHSVASEPLVASSIDTTVNAQDIAFVVQSVSGMQPLGILLMLWAVGTAYRFVMLARACWYSHTLHRTSRANNLEIKLPACAQRLSSMPELRFHDTIASPMTVGFLRPWIVFPAHMEYLLREHSRRTADAQIAEQILVHELAHIIRRDTCFLLVQSLIQALLFWHPAVWVAAKNLEVERELACDDWVIAHASGNDDARKLSGQYAANLLRLAEQKQTDARRAQALACIPSKSQLGLRIRNLANRKLDHSAKLHKIWFGSLLLGVMAALGACSSTWPDASQVNASSLAAVLPSFGGRAHDDAVFHAAEAGDLDGLQALAAEGENLDSILNKRSPRTALNAAIRGGHQDIVQFLVESGVNVHRRVLGDATPLTEAARAGQAGIAAYLLAHGESPDHSSPADGSPLIAAVKRGDTAFVELLLSAGADVNLAVRGDGSPLNSAAAQGRLDLVMLLVEKGADINQHVPGDETPLANAIASANSEVVDYLMERGAQ